MDLPLQEDKIQCKSALWQQRQLPHLFQAAQTGSQTSMTNQEPLAGLKINEWNTPFIFFIWLLPVLVQWCRAEPWQYLQVGETGARSSHCELQRHHPRRKHSRDRDTMISYFSNEMEVKGCASPARPYWRTKWGPVSTRQHKVSHWIPRPVWKFQSCD